MCPSYSHSVSIVHTIGPNHVLPYSIIPYIYQYHTPYIDIPIPYHIYSYIYQYHIPYMCIHIPIPCNIYNHVSTYPHSVCIPPLHWSRPPTHRPVMNKYTNIFIEENLQKGTETKASPLHKPLLNILYI